jgi:glycosyltransferase involved in cell wall biosynthesis
MKIGMLTDVYKPVINGVTNSISLCKREMEAAGHEVYVFTFGHLDYSDTESRIIRSPAVPLSDTGYHLSLAYSRRARQKLREMDILHTHHPFISGRIATRYGRQLNLPIIFTNHTRYDLYLQAYLPLVPPALTNMVLETFLPSFTALCDLVIAPSAAIRQLLLDMQVTSEIAVVPNGIDLDRLYPPARRITRAELNIPDAATVLIYCGRLGPEKNLELLLRAFGGAARAVPNAHLVIVGGGPQEGALHETARELPRVHFTGPVDYDTVPAYLAMSDIFVTASVTEVHPLSVIEALAAGLPVLGIHSPGISDIVRDGVDGYLTDHNLAALTAMMVRILLEPEQRCIMAANALDQSKRFSISTTVAALLVHYERVISTVQSRPPKAKLWQAPNHKARPVLGD